MAVGISSHQDIEKLLAHTAQRALRYTKGVFEKRVAPTKEEVDRLRVLAEPLPDGPSDSSSVLALLDDVGSPATIASTGGRYFGFVTGGVLPAALAASWLAAAWDQNASLAVMSPIAARIERVVLDWVRDLLDLPTSSSGGLVTGATMANFTGLAAARHVLMGRGGERPLRCSHSPRGD